MLERRDACMIANTTPRSRFLMLMAGASLSACVASASGQTLTDAGVDPLAPLLDPSQWTVVQSAGHQFAKDQPFMQVQLLKSLAATGNDGIGRLMYSVNLVVGVDGRLLYSSAPMAVPRLDRSRSDAVYYMDDRGLAAGCPLELRDVTGDRVPEIIYRSGWAGASSSSTEIHVLQYSAAIPARFRDIRSNRFVESNWQHFRWLGVGNQTVAIVAVPIERTADPTLNCHSCPKFHEYPIYRWDNASSSFVVIETVPRTGGLHTDGEDPLQTDWEYILERLQNGLSSQPLQPTRACGPRG